MSLPKYLIEEKSVKKQSLKQEKRVRRQLASGALAFYKGDLVDLDSNKMYELKLAAKGKQVIVKRDMLEKIFKEAKQDGKLPVMFIEIGEYILIGEVIKKRS